MNRIGKMAATWLFGVLFLAAGGVFAPAALSHGPCDGGSADCGRRHASCADCGHRADCACAGRNAAPCPHCGMGGGAGMMRDGAGRQEMAKHVEAMRTSIDALREHGKKVEAAAGDPKAFTAAVIEHLRMLDDVQDSHVRHMEGMVGGMKGKLPPGTGAPSGAGKPAPPPGGGRGCPDCPNAPPGDRKT